MNIAFIGTGKVGSPLAMHLANAGHEVVLAQSKSQSESLTKALARSPRLKALPLAQAIQQSEIIFLATPFMSHAEVLKPIAEMLTGKILVDCTNPVGPGLSHGLRSEKSGSEWVQELVPQANVIKAFSIYGFENFENPIFPHATLKPAMLFCGNLIEGKHKVATLISDCGFEPVDVGGLNQALHLEHMTLLWVRMVRMGGHSPHLVWAKLSR